MPKKELEEIAVAKIAETDKAWKLTDGKNEAWFPKSMCELEEQRNSTMLTLVAPIWLLKDKGFI